MDITGMVIEKTYSVTILRFKDVRSYIFTAVFTGLSVAAPWLFHQFNMAGATFLPMFFFIFMAGLVFGWKEGLIVGLITPVISYAVSRMPAPAILSQVTVEAAVFGLTAGLLREKLHLRPFWSLTGAMIAGLGALFIFVLISGIAGPVYSPRGAADNAEAAVAATVQQGWPGLAIQLAAVPLLARFIERKLPLN
jgi:hypothetical protein